MHLHTLTFPLSVFLILLFTGFNLRAQFQPIQNDTHYQVMMDLTAVENDLLPVEVVPPVISEEEVEFHMPRIIPGTYDVHNYGRFLRDVAFLNAMGDTLEVEKLSLNRWLIKNAQDLYKISYKVEDTYDFDGETNIFQPAGTSQEEGAFLLNNFGYIGYLKGRKNQPYNLKIKKPKGFYGATALQGERSDTLDQFEIPDYFTVHDSPILYCRPDTATRQVGGAEVLVSVYSPGEVVSADSCMAEISAVLDGAADYLGGNLPVDKYAVLIYTVPMNQAGSSYGALEHHKSTVLYMPEFATGQFYSGVRDITSHEFFHIVTPLTLHSEQIADFDFIDPEMSKHIWLYEGVTEYNSHLVQVRKGLYSIDRFLNVIKTKMDNADRYNEDIPLTQASKHTLTFFKDQYMNFYQKGALAGMALDLKLIELSDGEMNLVDLLEDLQNTYGADTFFYDDRLFDEIAERSYPEIREFLARHYASAEPFPFEELLKNVGVDYQETVTTYQLSVGNISYSYNFETSRFYIDDVSEMDAFGQELGFEEGDEIVEFNGSEMTLDNISSVIDAFYKEVEPGDKVKVKIARPKDDGGYENKKLKAKAEEVPRERENVISKMDSLSDQQMKWRKAWINQ